MAKIPGTVVHPSLTGLDRVSSGKVRDTYALPNYPEFLLPFVTDRISIFDFVLAFPIHQKGEVLNALNVFWRTQVISDSCEHDLVAYGSGIDPYLPENLRGKPELQKRATVVRKLNILPIESIVRGYLSGNGWKSYQKSGIVAGHKLPSGLQDGSLLPFPLYTPSTKAEKGHDEYITADEVVSKFGFLQERRALQLYQMGRTYALSRGIILADTKFEGDANACADEMFTPDSSRYWDLAAWTRCIQKNQMPPSLDKEFVRLWGKNQGIDKLEPENPEHRRIVEGLIAPESVMTTTTRIYRYIFWRLTGQKLESFQKQTMKIAVDLPRIKVDVLLGSRSDLKQVQQGLDYLSERGIKHCTHIISAHRNPEELRQYAERLKAEEADVIIAAAGKAAQLPGVLKAWLGHYSKSNIPVIGVALMGEPAEASVAAKLSIEQLPGQPVELDEHGKAYFSSKGMQEAVRAALENEFLPQTYEPKAAEFNVL
jgi:phosphoribosylaminoimidazole-succinocarboxamide synthase